MRKVLVLLMALILSACRQDSSIAPVASPVGAYNLSTIDGQVLPLFYQDSLQVYNGSITLRADSTYSDILRYDYVYAGLRGTTTDTLNGRYRVVGSSIQFQNNNGYGQAGYDGTQITFSTGKVWIYRR